MENTQTPRPKTVAVVGTGMAGLATAHLLHQDPQSRYKVTLLEKVSFHIFMHRTFVDIVPVGGQKCILRPLLLQRQYRTYR